MEFINVDFVRLFLHFVEISDITIPWDKIGQVLSDEQRHVSDEERAGRRQISNYDDLREYLRGSNAHTICLHVNDYVNSQLRNVLNNTFRVVGDLATLLTEFVKNNWKEIFFAILTGLLILGVIYLVS